MTLISIKQQLIQAREAHYAVPLFDVYEPQGMDGTMEARVAMRARELALSGHEVERAYGDLSALEQHFETHGNA